MKKLIEAIQKYVQMLTPDDIDIKHKLCNLIYASTLIGSIGTFFVSLIITPNPFTLGTIFAAIVVIAISLHLSVRKRKHTLAALICILFIDEIIFPTMYFVNGGMQSGMQIWFVLGLVFIVMVLEGKLCISIFIISVLTLGSCFMLEVSGLIEPEPLEGTVWAVDIIQSLILVSIIFGVFVKLQTYLYTKQNNKILQQDAELIEAMKKLEAASRAKSDFLANMSHEIRTPINAIMGMNEIIIRDSKEEQTIQNSGRIQAASNNLLGIVNNILDFSKIESGKMEIICEDYKLSKAISDCYNIINLRAYNKGLSLKVIVNPDIPENLNGDKFHISQIVTNFLTNAVKYTHEGDIELSIDYEKIDDKKINLIISVTDTGVGIASEDIDKLFKNFQRIDEVRNRTIEGTGLGLAIASRLVDQMGGTINVKSESGKGSTFTATIPQQVRSDTPIGDFAVKHEENTGKKAEVKSESFTAPNAHILVVDDIYMNVVIVEGLLTNTKMQIDTALSGKDALALTDEHKYDVILLDHMMPEMDGIQTLHALKERKNRNLDTPVVVFTANAIKGADEEYLKEGFDNYLSKPVHGVDLEKMILNYLPAVKIVR